MQKFLTWIQNTDSFIVHVKTDNISKDIAEYIETRFETSNFEISRLLRVAKNKSKRI